MSGPPEELEELAARGEELGSARLLSFYDRLRARVSSAAAGRGGALAEGASEALLLVPDVFILLARLALDRQVPSSSRRLIGGSLLYFLMPIDLLPEAFIGPAGYLDDLVIACAVLGEAFGRDLESHAERHWSGSRRLADVLRDVSRTADSLLGGDLYGRVRRFLERRGISP